MKPVSIRVRSRRLPRGLFRSLTIVVLTLASWKPVSNASDLAGPGLEIFESKIRPLLASRCYGCHSKAEGKVKAGLELDWKGGWEKGGDSGPAIVAGDPEKSLVIKAVRFTDPSLQMPPKGERLSAQEIEHLSAWIKMGAPDPRNAPLTKSGHQAPSATAHWAFQPLRPPALPSPGGNVKDINPVDFLVNQKLEEAGLRPAEPANKHTLLRRAYFDLIGLPPTPEQSQAFLGDVSTNAFEKVVDELLASPHYGERWGRHWLDVARYSDTKGQFRRQRESSVYPYAWTYRDYVIESFNQDKPYPQFIQEQIAADLLPRKDPKALAALGFLTLGDRFNGNENEIINDRIDVLSKGFLGLTVSCARCHDHRFDPVPTADYYSLHGILASSVEPSMKPLLTKAQSSSAAAASYAEQRSKLEARMAEVSTNLVRTAFGDPRRLAGVYLFATTLPAREARAYLTNNTADPDLLQNWQRIARIGGRRDGGVFRIWQMAQRIPQGRFAEQTRRALAGLGQDDRTRNLPAPVIQVFRGKAPRNIAELAAMYGQVFAHPDAEWQETLNGLLAEAAVNIVPNRQRGAYFIAREQLDRLEMVHEGAPARAMVLYDSGNPRDSRIFVRGEAENPGPVVPRRFLEILSPTNRPAFTQGSGRLQLAQAISTSPLSYRTMANRIWQHHFGQGLVITPDDLGMQSTPPSHPELLEWLASQLQRNGGSIKALHKQLMLSDTYRRSSKPSPEAETRDPDNRLLSHSNVRRLEFEPLRDSILLVGGKLDLTIGGKPVDLSEGTHRSSGRRGGAMADRLSAGATRMSTAERRTVYGFVDREDLWEMLTVFDFANPSISSGKRYETTVPQQALFLMNSPLVVEQARNVTEREDFTKLRDEKERIHYLYSLLFQRIPTETEIQSGSEFVANWAPSSTTGASVSPNTSEGSAAQATRKRARAASPPSKPSKPLTAWAEYTHALFLTTEMSFVH